MKNCFSKPAAGSFLWIILLATACSLEDSGSTPQSAEGGPFEDNIVWDRLRYQADEDRPSYNLSIDPLIDRVPLVLQPDVEARLTFSIGPQDPGSVLGPAETSPELGELAGDEPLSLGVTLNCLVCAESTYQRRTLVYDPNIYRSEGAVEFRIRPDPTRVDAETGIGILLFSIDARGIDLDIIKVPIFVGDPSPVQIANWQAPVTRAIEHEDIDTAFAPDLVIHVAEAPGHLIVSLIPHQPDLKAALAGDKESTDSNKLVFKSGVTRADLEDLVRDAYFELRALIEQNEESLQEVYERLDRAVDLPPEAARLKLTETDRDAMLRVLRIHGARLYNRTFIRGERGLLDAMRVLEEFELSDSRALRVLVHSSSAYVPWQLLYPRSRGDIDTGKFWGFRYELGTRQLVDVAQASLHTLMDLPAGDDVLFAAYKGSSELDEVAGRARLLEEVISKRLEEQLLHADSRAVFLDHLRQDGPYLRLLIAYGHASSGTSLLPTGNGSVSVVDTVLGAWFQLSQDDYIEPGDIDDLAPPPDEGLLLESQPIVIFNACETGAGGGRPLNNNGFVGALTRAGARAVIVTETPVWNRFAFHFARKVIDDTLLGIPVQKALHTARIHHLEGWNNPLGLVYTLYGNPAAQIVKHKPVLGAGAKRQ